MVTHVQNKMIKFTIIIDISILGFKAQCKRVSKALFIRLCVENTLCIRYKLATFFTIRNQIVKKKFMRGLHIRSLCVTRTNLGQHKEFRVCALLVPNVRLALV